MTMQESLAKLRDLISTLDARQSELTQQAENIASQLAEIESALSSLTEKADALESILNYEASDVIEAVESLEAEVADKFPEEAAAAVIAAANCKPFKADDHFNRKIVMCIKSYTAETHSYNGGNVTCYTHDYQAGQKYLADHWRPGHCHIDGFYVSSEDFVNFVEVD